MNFGSVSGTRAAIVLGLLAGRGIGLERFFRRRRGGAEVAVLEFILEATNFVFEIFANGGIDLFVLLHARRAEHARGHAMFGRGIVVHRA